MSLKRNLKPKEERTDINISPMIDMVFILLIFFIVTTVFVDEVGIIVDKPQPNVSQRDRTDQDEPVVFRVLANGNVTHEGRDVSFDQIEGIVRDALSRAEVPVIIYVQRNAISGNVIRVIDSSRLGNAEKVSITQMN